MKCALALLVLPFVVACGSIRYVPVEMLYPAQHPDSSVVVGALQLRLRAGGEWLELSLRNHGPDSVVVDWANAVFVEPGGEVHGLLSAGRVGELESALRRSELASWRTRELPAADAEAWPATAAEIGGLRDSLGGYARGSLPPGGAAMEILYPAEHLRVGADGRVYAAPLLCRSGAKGRGAGFELHVPVWRGSGHEVITLVARPARR